MEKVIFEEVAAGQPLPLLSFYLSRNDVISFHQTVGIGRDDFVSPIMILAIAMSKMTEIMPLPFSTLHVGQQLDWYNPVVIGDHLNGQFVLRNRRYSENSILHYFDLEISNSGKIVADGRITLQTDA
jgi:acyl dehydratase